VSLTVVKLERPSWWPEGEPWASTGAEFSIDASLRGIERDRLVYQASGLIVAQGRLRAEGRSIFEDRGGVELLLAHWHECRKHVRLVRVPKGEEWEPKQASELEDYLDELDLPARQELCASVVEANRLGRKNV